MYKLKTLIFMSVKGDRDGMEEVERRRILTRVLTNLRKHFLGPKRILSPIFPTSTGRLFQRAKLSHSP